MNSTKNAVVETLINDLRQNVMLALDQKGYPHHRTLEVRTDHGSVIVEGALPTYHLRQVAIECIRGVPGVTSIVDRIRVLDDSQVDSPQHRYV